MKPINYEQLLEIAKHGTEEGVQKAFTPDVICEIMLKLKRLQAELTEAQVEIEKLTPIKTMLQTLKTSLEMI